MAPRPRNHQEVVGGGYIGGVGLGDWHRLEARGGPQVSLRGIPCPQDACGTGQHPRSSPGLPSDPCASTGPRRAGRAWGGGALRRGPAAAAPPCARRYCRGGGIRHSVYISWHTGSRYGSGVGSLVFAVPLLAVGRRLRLSAQRR